MANVARIKERMVDRAVAPKFQGAILLVGAALLIGSHFGVEALSGFVRRTPVEFSALPVELGVASEQLVERLAKAAGRTLRAWPIAPRGVDVFCTPIWPGVVQKIHLAGTANILSTFGNPSARRGAHERPLSNCHFILTLPGPHCCAVKLARGQMPRSVSMAWSLHA